MSRKNSTRSSMALVLSGRKDVSRGSASNLHRMRSAVDVSEDADAQLTGMTRSLDRRLLALNLQPVSPASEPGYMKVA